ncbi:MAG TPA: hypothetical protein VGV57_12525 [Thermoleophilaceae bacterium]|nr:hypothetical protein [Thermoleophilaceae bacterium]
MTTARSVLIKQLLGRAAAHALEETSSPQEGVVDEVVQAIEG